MPTFPIEPFEECTGEPGETARARGHVFLPGWGTGDTDPVRLAILRQVLPSVPFQRLRRHPAILGALRAIYDGPVVSTDANMIRIVPPGATHLTTRPHQDGTYVRTPGLWIAWMAREECPLESGPLAVIPGSHRDGLVTSLEFAPGQVWAASPVRPGDVLLFHGCTIHRACENRTPDRTRISADFRYAPGEPAGSEIG